MVGLAQIPLRMSVEEFLNWEPEDGLEYQLVDGEPRAMAPAGTIHAFLQNELGRLIGNHLRERDSGCEVLANPGIVPHVLSAHNVRIPDLAVTCSPLSAAQRVLTDPVLVVEILSPGNQAKTWANVWAYTSIPGLTEILVLRTDRIAAELLRRSPEGAWPERTTLLTAGDLVLESVGLRLPLAALFARVPL
ncbi:MAG TPA: Uma2 family endonuclease [Acetobacteraceae bacterium]|nr:Uma2 family endonuclease [Acetobacteraceae bacterium]